MAPAFSKEAILCGSIDHLCLVCASYLRTERDVCQHVSTLEHQQKLDSTGYVEKYKSDRVRKIKKWYFCEFCNVLMSTMTTAGLHIEEPIHMQKKSEQIISRVNDVIVSENITIQEEAWHGFISENTCIICDIEYDDKNEHKNGIAHVVNLIQSKVIIENNNVYRKNNDFTFHCLICNEIVPEISTHVENPKHKNLLQGSIGKLKEDLKIDENTKDKPKVVENYLDNPEHQNIKSNNKDAENSNAKRANVHDTKNKGNDETISKETVEQTDDANSVQEMAKKYGLNYNCTNNRVYCQICNKRVPSSVKNINEHVNGESHKNTVRLAGSSKTTLKTKQKPLNKPNKMCNLPKVPLNKFTRIIQTFTNKITYETDILLNQEFCIDYYTFTYLTKIDKRIVRCQVCEVSLPLQHIKNHVNLSKHERALNEVPVIICSDSEFIREIRSGIFQCGFCNIYAFWEEMQDHLKSGDHMLNKNLAKCRLSKYLKAMNEYNTEVEATSTTRLSKILEEVDILAFLCLLHELCN